MKLHRLRYSPYARKVQTVLELAGIPHELVDAPYGDRRELAELTGGYVMVPVLVDDDGTVVVESRDICERLVARPEAAFLVPAPLDGPIWAFHDFVDGALEDVLFRIASPSMRDRWEDPWERALYVFVKERKFGPGCVDAWLRDREALFARARRLLAPTARTLEARPFVFGDAPTLADAALHGQWMMLDAADPALLAELGAPFVAHARRMEDLARARRARP